jgi:hypothetical protein
MVVTVLARIRAKVAAGGAASPTNCHEEGEPN